VGVRRAVRDPAPDRSARLTTRERDLAALVGLGLTNPEIARRMGLGRPTVARLLSNAMSKLGVDSRTQLAARIDELV
jgi:non-specific serine/threonine protein kinase